MIAFDTNVVLRLLILDDEKQSAAAADLLEEIAARKETVLIPDIVLCELEWVLRAGYGVPAGERFATFRALLDDPTYTFEERDRLRAAIEAVAAGRGDLSDQLLGLRAREAGASTTYTFDRKLRKDPRFTVV